jgi:hypothetical protein
MDSLIQGFNELRVGLSWPQIADIYNKYAESLGYSLDYQEIEEMYEDCEIYGNITPDMVTQWCWIFFSWLHNYYHMIPPQMENMPLKPLEEELEIIFVERMEEMLKKLWMHDTQREMFPEEEKSLREFISHFRSYSGR